MAKKLDPKIADVLRKHGFGPESCWDCHGTWVIYHKVLERIAMTAGIKFDAPQIIESDGANKIAAVCVTGHLGDVSIWSIGESAPDNCKNAYPWAMAEKRAIDRVVLKLIGLSGDVYSEEEADDFKGSAPKKLYGPLGKSEMQKQIRAFTGDVADCDDSDQLIALLNSAKKLIEQCERDEPDWYYGFTDKHGEEFNGLKFRIEAAKEQTNGV